MEILLAIVLISPLLVTLLIVALHLTFYAITKTGSGFAHLTCSGYFFYFHFPLLFLGSVAGIFFFFRDPKPLDLDWFRGDLAHDRPLFG